jgi:pilin isopeptide linkage protein
MTAVVKYSPEDPTFENYYVTNDVSVEFEGVKELKGRDLEAGEFTFELYDSEGNLLETAQNDATGKVKFSTITYTKADDLGAETEKTFTYTVKETSGSLGGVTYDTNEATITVTVKDDGEGNLTAEVTPAEAPLFTFTNTYEAEGEITLSGTKVLEGGELTEGQFSFELVDSEGNVVETVSNAADGSFSFTTLTYQKNPDKDETGTYTYKIREKIPEDKKGIAYTDKVYDVTITVKDNKDGTLSVTSSPDAGSFSFTNKVLKVLVNKYNDSNKKLKGATITLYDENGAEIVSWTSDGKEPFDFGPYVEAGKKYMIKETKVPKGYTRFKPVVFTVDPDGTVNISLKVDKEGAYKLVDKTIPKEDTPPDKYIPPVVPLPPTDVNGGNSNTGMMGGMLAASMAGVIAALYQLLKNRKQYN